MTITIKETPKGIEIEVTKIGQKGYVAQITGPHPTFQLARKFLKKEITQIIDYGLYEVREGAAGKKQYFSVTPPIFEIPGQQKVFVEEVSFQKARSLAVEIQDAKKTPQRRGIYVSGQFYERKQYRGPRIEGDYPDRHIPGNPPPWADR